MKDRQHTQNVRVEENILRIPRTLPTRVQLPENFVPMRLIPQPGRVVMELQRSNLLVGRHSTADIRLALPDVSRRHCRFLFSEGQWEVIDLNSLNGIFVNGERLRESVLFNGDKLRIGSVSFIVELALNQSRSQPTDEPAKSSAIIKRIVDVLPHPATNDCTEEYRRAS